MAHYIREIEASDILANTPASSLVRILGDILDPSTLADVVSYLRVVESDSDDYALTAEAAGLALHDALAAEVGESRAAEMVMGCD